MLYSYQKEYFAVYEYVIMFMNPGMYSGNVLHRTFISCQMACGRLTDRL